MKRKTKRRNPSKKRRSARVAGDQSFAPSVISGMRRKKGRKRAKMGAVSNKLTQTLLGVLGGAAAGLIIEKYVPLDSKIKGGLMVLGGAGAAYYGMKKGSNAMAGAGAGLLGAGAVATAKNFGLISGMDDFMRGIGLAKEDTMLIEMSGDPSFISGEPVLISGDQSFAPDVVSGNNENDLEIEADINGTKGEMPSIISGY